MYMQSLFMYEIFCYSHSWGYRKVFEQFSYAIQQKYPNLVIQGDNYPPTKVNAYLAQAISLLKFAIIILLVSGQNPFAWLHVETPTIYTWATENKVSFLFETFRSPCFLLFLVFL